MLEQSDLDKILSRDWENSKIESRTVSVLAKSLIKSELQCGQKIYRVNQAKMELTCQTFVGFFHWIDGEHNRVSAVVCEGDDLRNVKLCGYLLRHLTSGSRDDIKAWVCRDSAERALRRIKRQTLESLRDQLSGELEVASE